MTKKKNLTAFMIAIIVMLFSLPANAQGTVGYAQYDKNSKTLTFYGGKSVPTDAYALNTGSTMPMWKSDDASVVASSCKKVVFDASFKDVRPTSCYFWFQGFSNLLTIEDIRYLNTDNVKTMQAMFNGCSGLTTLDVSKFNTAKVTDMECMFGSCSKLTSLNLSNFNTANVEYMYQMFNGCSDLTSLDLSSFNTANVEYMYYMFNGCSSLTSLDLSSFNTAKVTDMGAMFFCCSGLTSLDLSSFNTAKVTGMDNMFYGCSGLTKIYVSDDFTTDEVSKSTNMFKDCTSLKGKASYSKDNTGIEMANYNTGYFTKSNLTPYVKWNGYTKVLTFKVANYTEGTQVEWKLNEGDTSPGWSIDEVKNKCTNVVFTPSFNHARPTSCYKWFNMFSGLTTIQGIENLNTEEVKNMGFMFGDCKDLTSLDLSSFNTANVTTMHAMFYNCSELTSLDVSKFNTAKVTHMTFMFSGCSGLTSLDVSKFNTANVEYMYHMFNGCKRLTSLDLSSFNTDKVGLMYYMFYGCSGLTSLDLSSFNTAKVTDMGNMFYGCSGLTTIYVSDDFTTDKVSSSTGMFEGCSQLVGAVSYSDSGAKDKSMANYKTGYFTKSNLTPYVKWNADTKVLTFKVAHYIEGTNGEYIILNEGDKAPKWVGEVSSNCEKVVFTPSFKQAKPTSCCRWFQSFSNLSTIEGIGYLNTEEVTNMDYMFFGCSGLTSLDLSSFNTAEVTDMFYMFGGCSGLKTIYVSDAFTTNKVRSDGGMFASCVRLKGATSYNSNNTGIEMAKYTTGYFKTYFTLGEKKVELCGENPLTTESLDLSGDYDFTPKFEAFTAKSATYTRDLSTSGSTWFSLCLPFAYTPNNFTAYQLKGATGDAVEIEEITGAIAAGTPVLFKFNDGEEKKIDISVSNADIENDPGMASTTENDCQLYGTYQEKTFSLQDGNTFIIYKDRLMNPAKMLDNKNVTKVGVKPFRAYMTMTSKAGTGAKSFSIGSGDEGTTAIDLLNSVATDDAEYYDINGRRIDAPAKGLNIVRRGNKTMKLIIK